MARMQDEDRAIIEDDGTYHYGLIREGTGEFQFVRSLASLAIDLPAVDIKDIPESQRLWEWMQVEDQKQQGSCQGNARTSAEELALWRQSRGTIVQLSRQFAYITSQQVDGIRGDRGSTMEGGAKASQKFGSCLESFAPYTGQYYTNFSQEAYTDAKRRTLTTFSRLDNYDEVLRWLVHGIGGVVIGIGWNGSCEPDDRGCIENYRGGGGGHALALLDWSKTLSDAGGRPYIDMYNSWGKRWGRNGRAFINPRVVDQWCKTQTVLGYSKMNADDLVPQSYDWIKQSFFS